MNNAVEENSKHYSNKILMRIQFILEIYVYKRRLLKKIINSMVLFMDRIDITLGFVPLLDCRLQI